MRHDLCVELLERDTVLSSLQEYAAEARAGDGRVVLVAGEAGVGKTTLLEALVERLAGARVLVGSCEGAFTPRPLGPLLDVVDQLGGELARTARTDASREPLFKGILDALTGAPDDLTVLCIEDLHWCDEATLDLLQFLAPRLRRSRTLLLLTYRDDGLAPDHPLRAVVGELASQRSTRRIGLAPLSRSAVARMTRGSALAAEDLYGLTGGNPFLVTELLEAGTAQIPPSTREAVLARVSRLSAQARHVLEAAAVIGSRVEIAVLEKVMGSDAWALDEVLTSGALISDATTFRFRHEIARMAVEEATPAHRRTALHRRILEVLTDVGYDDDPRLAHHAEGAGDGGAVLRFAPRAAERAARLTAHRESAAQYERALRWAQDADPALRARFLDALATQDSLVDRWSLAAEARQQAMHLWDEVGDRLRFGDSLRLQSKTLWRLCRGEDAKVAALAALTVLEEFPHSRELGWAVANLASFHLYNDDEGALELALRAQQLAERLDDDPLLSDALNTEGCALVNLDRGGIPELQRSLQHALDSREGEQAGRAYANLQAVLSSAFRFTEAEQIYRDGIAYCDEHDLGTYANCLRGGHIWVLTRLGAWDDAEQLCRADLARPHLSPINRLTPLIALGLICGRRGDPEGRMLLDEATALSDAGGDEQWIAEVGLGRVELAWLSGDGEGARREIATLAPIGSGEPWMRWAFARWRRRCGDPGVDPADATQVPPYTLETAGDWRGAADAWLALGCRYDAALALLDSGDPAAMAQALALFDELGAGAAVAAAQRELRRRGAAIVPRGRRATTKADPFGLTRREHEVLALLREDLTNAEIAARLFIAEKTVDHHVSSVLMKMGVASRRDAAHKAAELPSLEGVAT